MIDFAPLEPIAGTLLHEGSLLYPYRPSALKNTLRWTFGCLFPSGWSALGEPSWLQVECLLQGNPETRVSWCCRFLYLLEGRPVVGRLDGPFVTLDELSKQPLAGTNPYRGDPVLHVIWQASVTNLGERVFRLRVRIDNGTQVELPCPSRDEALGQSLLSCHLLLGVEGGCFLSSMDPPTEHRERSASCRNVGVWPVLAGDPASPAFMIASPIILYDFPQIAPQSPGELFDATEIDEMLRLRVLTLTDQEKQEASSGDAGGRQVIERLDAISESVAMTLRGVWKGGPRPGDRVRLKPSRRADALDHTLAGHAATVVSLDVDLEGMQHIGVVLDEDPGRDLGLAGWPGHRFYFAVEEVEPL